MANETETPSKRPACGYKISDPAGQRPCGSEDNLHTVKGKSKTHGRDLSTDVCGKHRIDVVRDWNWDSIVPRGRE